MTSTALLSELQNQGVILQPRGEKLAFGPRDRVTPELKAKIMQYKKDLLRLLQSDRTLAEAYCRYWNTPETEPMATFVSLHREIDLIEKQVGAEVAWRTLEAAARRWYEEHRACPFCKHPDVLHFEKGVTT